MPAAKISESNPLTQELLKKLYTYEPETGIFRSNGGRRGAIKGAPVGYPNKSNGRLMIKVLGKAFLLHRLAWLYVTGTWPEPECDHKNRNFLDNRFANLREANRLQNMQNKSQYKSNTSGAQGVSWHKKTGKWVAQIASGGRNLHLGLFENIESAAAAYQTAKAKLHPFYA